MRKFKGIFKAWHGVGDNFFVLKFIVELLGLGIIFFRFVLVVLICDFCLDQRQKESACEKGIGARKREEKMFCPCCVHLRSLHLIISIFVWMDGRAILAFLVKWYYNCLELHFHLVRFSICWWWISLLVLWLCYWLCRFESVFKWFGESEVLVVNKNHMSKRGREEHSWKGKVTSLSLINLVMGVMGVKVMQQVIVDLIFDIMVECCQPSEVKKFGEHQSDPKTRGCLPNGNNVNNIFSCHQVFRTYSPEDHTIRTLYLISRIINTTS